MADVNSYSPQGLETEGAGRGLDGPVLVGIKIYVPFSFCERVHCSWEISRRRDSSERNTGRDSIGKNHKCMSNCRSPCETVGERHGSVSPIAYRDNCQIVP